MSILTKILRHTDLLLGVGLLVVVGMLILPLPHWIVDLGLVVAIAGSVLMLLMAVNVEEPLQFSVFPSLLLISTLFRLALSIAATKLILGTGDAGQVITTFGNFVMGGDFVVGFVAFLILMVVQFMVITNGAGRVSEVVARFTLDAMPGKQMAIDADLAAGLIDENQARDRRKGVKLEADFYGAMDGASKFVKGDAVASLMIIAINLVGGFAVGFFRGEGDAMAIMRTYSLLSVGEGLAAQIPALLISTASGLLVTRSGQERSMGGEVVGQFLNAPKSLAAAGGALALFAFIPGFPAFAFLGVAGVLFGAFRFIQKNPQAVKKLVDLPDRSTQPKSPLPGTAGAPAAMAGPEAVLSLLAVDTLEIEIGYGLTKLADPRSGGDLSERVAATRRQIALDLGYVMPSVRIRDSTLLETNEYVVKVRGEEVARARAESDLLLAIENGVTLPVLSGIPTTEPVFSLPARWIEPNLRETAERAGYTVVEPTAMIATHLSEIVQSCAAEILSRQDVQTLLDQAKAANSVAVEELVPTILTVGDIQKVLQHLLRERVPIRDLTTIFETLADFGPRTKDPDQLGELVRAAISRTITRQVSDAQGKLSCITLEPALEQTLVEQLQQSTSGFHLALDPATQQTLMENLRVQSDAAMAQGAQPVLLCRTQLRLPLRRLVERTLPSLPVLAYNEVAARADVELIGAVAA